LEGPEVRRRLRQVAVTLVLIPVFLAASLIPKLRPPAYAASQAPPAPIPEDPLAQQPEQQTPEISIDVDVRDGHLSARVVDIWGPGRRPLIVRSMTNAPMKSQTAANPGWEWNLLSDVTGDGSSSPVKWQVREPDGNRGTFEGALPPDTGTALYEKTIGSYATMDVHQTCVGPPGERDCTVDLWTVHLSKGVNLTYQPNPTIIQTGQPDGLLKEIRDANGNVTTAGWVFFGDALQSNYIGTITDSVGRVTTFTYERGEVAGCIDAGLLKAKGKVPAGPVTPAGCVNYYNYRIVRVTDPYGRYAAYTYNGNNVLTSVLNGAGYTTSYAYGSGTLFPLLTGVINARGNRTTINWGLNGTTYGVTSVVAPGGATTTYAYPTTGQTTVTDALNHTTTYAHSSRTSGVGGST
jgi:hypothetical protein